MATPQIDAEVDDTKNIAVGGGEVHDGHYFIRLLENEIFKFEEQICDFEELVELSNSSSNTSTTSTIPDDVMDSILAAVGKAKLLMSQKLVQFRGLCDKNIAAMDPNAEHDPFVPTSEDLAGFWDMVYIQVEHIHTLFAELRELQSNGWKKPEPVPKSTSEKNAKNSNMTKKKTRPASARAVGKKKIVGNNGKEPSASSNDNNSSENEQNANKKSEAAKARDEARKKMMAERKKKMMELKQKKAEEAGAENKNDELFVVF